jgi:hypothetical protein
MCVNRASQQAMVRVTNVGNKIKSRYSVFKSSAAKRVIITIMLLQDGLMIESIELSTRK